MMDIIEFYKRYDAKELLHSFLILKKIQLIRLHISTFPIQWQGIAPYWYAWRDCTDCSVCLVHKFKDRAVHVKPSYMTVRKLLIKRTVWKTTFEKHSDRRSLTWDTYMIASCNELFNIAYRIQGHFLNSQKKIQLENVTANLIWICNLLP